MSFALRYKPKPGFTPALSLWQPWASAMVITPPIKRIETRGYPTNYRGPVVIHAARHWTQDEISFWGEIPRAYFGELPEFPDMLPFGALIGLAEIYACDPIEKIIPEPCEEFWGNYTARRFGYFFHKVQRFSKPVPYRGLQGFFSVPNEIIEAALKGEVQS